MKLTGEKADAVRYWLNNDCNSKGEYVHWTLKRLSLELKLVYDLDISVAALGATLKKMKIALKRPRPMHYNSSPVKQEEFKKNLPIVIETLRSKHDKLEIAFQDEARFGTLTSLCRSWKNKGSDFEVK